MRKSKVAQIATNRFMTVLLVGYLSRSGRVEFKISVLSRAARNRLRRSHETKVGDLFAFIGVDLWLGI
jgi:hypothetical protein